MSRLPGLTNRVVRSLAGAGGYLLCAAGFVLTLVAFYPGLMSADSVDQWTQGHAWSFYDVHPPLMSALWGLFDRVVAGPFLMLVFHNLLFWSGAALFWRTARDRSPRLGLCFAAFGFMPQVWAFLPVIWKDVGLGASFLLASALIYTSDRKGSLAALLASVPLMFYGYGVRLNAAPAALPLALWSGLVACRVFPRLKALSSSRRFVAPACGLLYFALLAFAVSAATGALVGGRTLYPYQQVLLFDLAGVSKETGSSQFPDYVSGDPGFSLEQVTRAYAPGGVNTLIYGSPPPLKITSDGGNVASLRSKWWAVVSTHKVIYLEQRWALFAQLTGFNTEGVPMAFYPATGLNNPPQFRRPLNALTRALTSYFFFFSRSVLFRGFFWILLSAGLVYLSLRLGLDGETGAAFVLAASGLLYALGYFFYVPSAEFRYLWWTVLAACASTILLSAHVAGNWQRLRGRRVSDERAGVSVG
jgi:hypothetical protein